MNKNDLAEFQEFLRSRRLVLEKYITFYAHRARKFPAFSDNNKNLRHDLHMEKFLNCLSFPFIFPPLENGDFIINNVDKSPLAPLY
ncbi:MAG: hypothetical protein ACW98X_25645 [Promethearchaeota archaeon]|jgi:hypothetical protein